MAILNVTPDSFAGDGLSSQNTEDVVARALQMVQDGADILDVGGESTRPGATVVSTEEEIDRIVPVVESLAAAVSVPISIDTTKAAVAQRALAAGASIINDISGATADTAMLSVLAQSDCGCVLMHRRGTPQSMGWSAPVISKRLPGEKLNDVIEEVLEFWSERVNAMELAGIARERIVLDAGFGFGKSVAENLELLRRGRELSEFGYPTLSATSRKSTIGKILGDAPVDERVWGTAATTAIAIANGADIVRVHDVREMAQVADMTDAIVRCAEASLNG